MKAADVMVKEVMSVKQDSSVDDAIKLLAEQDVSALPVVDDTGRLVGVLSEFDLMRRPEIGTEKHRPWWMEAITPAAILAHEFAKAHGQRVHEVMSRHVVSASEDTPLGEIAALFERHRIKRVPILRDGKLVGTVSRSNLIQALASSRAVIHAATDTDRDIRTKVLSRLAEQDWTGFGARNIIVTDGVVHLWGLVGSEDEREALTALAEEVPGVVSVCDEMIPAY
jgi:CBS-domain-containing membrane protein